MKLAMRGEVQKLRHQNMNSQGKDARYLETFKCPACNANVEAQSWKARAGMKCPSCGIGFIPEKIETRDLQVGDNRGSIQARMIIYGILIVVAICMGFISLWLAIAITIITLLAAILGELSRLNRK